jgi:hypothetical protein
MENQTHVGFDPEEQSLLDKGLKYNLHYRKTPWIRTLAIEAETIVNQIQHTNQNHMRFLIPKNIKNLQYQYSLVHHKYYDQNISQKKGRYY